MVSISIPLIGLPLGPRFAAQRVVQDSHKRPATRVLANAVVTLATMAAARIAAGLSRHSVGRRKPEVIRFLLA
jgi:hypothetical protein